MNERTLDIFCRGLILVSVFVVVVIFVNFALHSALLPPARYNITTTSGQEINGVFIKEEGEHCSEFYDPFGTTYIVRESYKKEKRK